MLTMEGTTQIVGPAADIQNFYANIPGAMTLAAYNTMMNKQTRMSTITQR